MTQTAQDSRDLGPFAAEGRWRRIVPFAGVVLVALAVAVVSIDTADLELFTVAAVASIVLIGLALIVPWRRLPRWSQAIVPLGYLPVVGVLRDATGGPSSPFTVLVLLPILLFALYGNRREVGAAVLVQSVVLGAPALLGFGTSSYPMTELYRAALFTAVSLFVGVLVHDLVTRLVVGAASVAEAEARARDAHDQLAGVLDGATQVSIIATDAHGAITVFNEGASRMFGYAPEEMIGRTPAVLHDPAEVVQRARELDLDPREVFVAAARTGEADVQDWTYIRRSGERLTVSLTVTAIRDAGGTPTGFIGVGRDVTEQRRNELQISEQAHRAGLINDLAQTIRQDLEPTSVLRRAVTALGQALDVDRVVVRFADDDQLGSVAESWSREGVSKLPLNTAPAAGIVRLSRRMVGDDSVLAIFDVQHDARLRPTEAEELRSFEVQSYLGAPMWVGSRAMGWLSVHTRTPRSWTHNDIAIVHALARTVGAALLQAQSYQQEQEISQRLRELDQTKSDFVSSVSHELRTPLTSITGYLEMLVEGEAGDLTGDQLQLLEVVERNSRRLLDLIEQLLTLSRIEAGNIRPGADPVDLVAVLGEVHRAVLPMLSERDLRFAIDVPADLGIVTGDAGQLERVVLNLVTNAIKFTPDGGTVAIVAAGADGRAQLSVSDTGIGIPQDEQEQLFTRFFRSSTARQHAIQGTGLGLAIVKSIVEGHGGSIEVDSAPGRGTTVTVELPLAVPALQTVGAS